MKIVYTACCLCGAPSTDRIRREEDGKTVETRYYCQPCVEREWQRLADGESLPCEDCGHTPCDCDQMRAAEELLCGGEKEAFYLSDDDGFDEPHGDECCCEDCLQDYPERDALYNNCEFYGVQGEA